MVFNRKTKLEDLQKECEVKGLSKEGTVKELKERLKKYKAPNAGDDLFAKSKIEKGDIISKKSSINHFFIQVNLSNLSMYFINGLIYPINLEQSLVYKNENRKHDLFNVNPDFLLISNGVINDFDESQVLVEVILTATEIESLIRENEMALLNMPLPISRVSGVYFLNNSTRNSYLSSIEVFPDTFIPREICFIIKEQINTVQLVEFPKHYNNNSILWEKLIKRYDRLMGLIAFLKNTSLFFTNRTNEYIEYTSSYFLVLGLINSYDNIIQKENAFFKWIIYPETIDLDNKLPRFQFREILNAIYSDVEFDINWGIKLMEDSINFEQPLESKDQQIQVYKIFCDYRNQKIDYRSILSHPFVQKNIPLTILVFLIKFSNKNVSHSDKQAVKNYFRNGDNVVDKSTAEYIFAVLGLYYGYSNLIKDDRLDFDDSFFNSLAKESSQIKFKLDSYLDKFTVESMFQFVKNDSQRLTSAYDFLNTTVTKYNQRLQLPRSHEAEYTDLSYKKYGKAILHLKRISANQIIAKDVESLYPNFITSQDHLFTFVAKNYPELIHIDKLKLLELIANQSLNTNLQELRDTIELDKKYGKNNFKR